MKLDRFRAPALAATAVLMISGVGSAFAASSTPIAPVQAAPITQVSVPETVEAADTDTLQEGDQTTVDIAGSADTTAEAPEAAGVEASSTEASSTEADGPGGHADADGQNVDHQFDGNE